MIFETYRTLPVSTEAVFDAFKDPAALATWWGPDGFTNIFSFFDFKPNGKWSFTMNGPDGRGYPNESLFQEILAPNRIVIRHVSEPQFTLTVSIEEIPGVGTQVSWRQQFDSPSVASKVAHIVVPANEQNLDRLSRYLGV